MKTSTQETIRTLLGQRANLSSQLTRLQTQQAETEQRIDKAIREGDPNDATLLRNVSDDRLRLEMFPAKIEQTNQGTADVDVKLAAALNELSLELSRNHRLTREKAVAQLDEAIKPFVSDASAREMFIGRNQGLADNADTVRNACLLVIELSPDTVRSAAETGRLAELAQRIISKL